MSLQLVSDLSNETETIVGVDGNLWFKRAHVGKYLDIKDIKHNFKDFLSHYTRCSPSTCSLNECEMSTSNAIRSGPKDQKNKCDIFLLRRGVLYVIKKCRKPTPNLINLTKCHSIELHKSKWLCKEQETLDQIMQALNGEEMIHQFGVEKYMINLYFLYHRMNWLLNAMSLTIVIETLDTR